MLGGGFDRVRLSEKSWFWGLLLGVCLVASVSGFAVVEAAEDKPTIWITIHRIQSIDSIEGPLEGEPDWYYRLEVWDGGEWQFLKTKLFCLETVF